MTKLLIVDDHEQDRYMLQVLLKGHGCEVALAADGAEALEVARRDPPDVVISDILMPVMDGFALCRKWKRDEALKHIPFVFYTATYTDPKDEKLALSLGAERFIVKPAEPDVFIEILQEVIEAYRADQLVAPREPIAEEEIFFKEYNEALIRKLEDKVIALEQEITERKRTEEEIQRRVVQQEALNAIIAAAAAAADLPELLETALDRTLDALGLEMGGIWLPPYASLRGLPSEMHKSMEQITLMTELDIPSASIIEDWQQTSSDSPLLVIAPVMANFGIRASLTVPLLAEGRRVGGLSLAAAEPRPWGSAEVALTEAVGQQVGTAAERLYLLAQIQEQAQRVQQIVDTVPEGVLLLDTDGQVVLANPVAVKDLAPLADAGVGDILTHLGDRPLTELLTSPPEGLWHDVAADGRSFQVIARPIEISPTPEGWVMVIRDVTRQREVEWRIQQQERLAAVGQLAAGIAHDFNNIMATIVLYAQMSGREEGLSVRSRERMETINQQAQHATKLIQQILDFSRRTVLERRPMDLSPFLREQAQLLERTLPENIKIDLVYGPDEYRVNADPTSLQQVVMNLALNARDAMIEGGSLRIELKRIEIGSDESPPLPEMDADEWAQLTVSDTGTGIPSDMLSHIFEPFFTTKEAGSGSGLGLSQVHGIVGSHGGHIDVETRVDRGTTFTIYLPILPPHPSELLTLEMEPLVTGQEETILVVEDNAAARDALVESLKQLNYQVTEAANGREALAILEQRGDEIALVLSDVVMPDMGGIALFHTLREQGLTVPVVLLTGHPMEKELKDLRAQGLNGWLLKPPNLEQLAEVVARALRGNPTNS